MCGCRVVGNGVVVKLVFVCTVCMGACPYPAHVQRTRTAAAADDFSNTHALSDRGSTQRMAGTHTM